MGTGYVRQSAADIVAGNTVEATPLNLEFNQLRDAFHETSGHSHDATTGEGPKIALTTSVSGVLPVANGGYAAIHKINGTTAPTVNDDSGDGYGPGSVWVDTTNDKVYVCLDATLTAAVWSLVGTTAGNQPLDATLTAVAGVTTAANKGIYFTGVDVAAAYDLSAFALTLLDDASAAAVLTTLGVTAFAQTILDDANQAAVRTTLGLTPGTDVQAYDADLTALAALSGTNTIYYRSGAATWTAVTIDPTLTFSAGTLSVTASAADPELAAISGLTSAADRLPYFTGSGTAALATFTSYARTLVDDATAGDALTTLGVSAFAQTILDDANAAAVLTTIGAQPLDSDLTALAALTTNAAGRSILTLTDPNADRIAFWDDSAGAYAHLVPGNGLQISTTDLRVLEVWEFALSDETTAITTGTAKLTVRAPYAFTITAVRASLSTASSSGIPTVDINDGGTTILSTKLTIDANEKTSTTAATAAVISDSAFADDAEITFDIDVAGTGAKGLKVKIYGYRT